MNDKHVHFLVGLILGSAGSVVHPSLGMAACAIAGYGKERWDRQGRGTYDGWDCAATLLGGGVGQAVALIGGQIL